MSILSAYEHNQALRAQFFKMNCITHAFSWKETARRYSLYFGGADCCGWPEGEFTSLHDLKAFVNRYAPELQASLYRANH